MSEWIPVISSAIVLVFIPLGFLRDYYFTFKKSFKFIIWLQLLVGLLGFLFHLYPIVSSDEGRLVDRIRYVPPIMAPLLFCNLAFLMAFGWRSIIDHNKKDVLLLGWFLSHVR